MVNRLEIAKQFVQEQLGKRDDIIGVIVAGSVARGEDIEGSDIDLGFIVKGVTFIIIGTGFLALNLNLLRTRKGALK